MAARVKIAARENILSLEDLHQEITAQLGYSFIDLQYDILVIVFFFFSIFNHLNPWNSLQSHAISEVIFIIYPNELIQAFQRSEPHRGRYLAHFAICADIQDRIYSCKAKIAHPA